jgi:ABC-type multidrug transport system permease subunit
VVGGHFIAMFVIVFIQQLILVIFGQLALGVNYLAAPLGVLLVMAALSFCMAAMGMLIGVFAKGEEQVILYSLIAMFLFSSLGGAWFPLEFTGKAFATIGRLTPTGWAMIGFQNFLIRELKFSSALLPSGILLLYALGFFIIGAWRLRKEL